MRGKINKRQPIRTIDCSIEKFQNFDNGENSIRFNYRLISQKRNKELTPIEIFIEEKYKELGLTGKNYLTDNKKTAINCILTNTVIAASNGKIVAVPRGRCDYTMSNFYGMTHYSYRNIVKSIDAIKESDYVYQRNGFFDKDEEKGEVSRIWGTEKIFTELADYSSIPDNNNNSDCPQEIYNSNRFSRILSGSIKKIDFTTPIHLKNNKKKMIKYSLTKEIWKMKSFLSSYNDFIQSFPIQIPYNTIISNNATTLNTYLTIEPGIEYTYSSSIPLLGTDEANPLYLIELDGRLYRVFNNGNFNEGGRFYGADYQLLNSEQRKAILINGNKTVEVDFQALHPRMLYHLKRIDYQDDPYTAVSNVKELRKPIKKMMQMMINAKTKPKAIGAFEKFLKAEPEFGNILYPIGLDARELINIIAGKHKKLHEFFNTGIGIVLQKRDSQIAESVLKYFMKKDVVCLCVHDSFIVEDKYGDELIDVMKKEYKKEMGFEGKVKVN